jgi:hypothetical protein
MAECVPGEQARHRPNFDVIAIELHRLVSIFLASRSFADLMTTPEGHASQLRDPIFQLQECEDDEISRILLAVAISGRVLDDNADRVLGLFAGTCGTLVADLDHPDRAVPLELREAFNKILHAESVHGDIDRSETRQIYRNPVIYLYGTQHRRRWKATLDVVAFAKEYMSNVRMLAQPIR